MASITRAIDLKSRSFGIVTKDRKVVQEAMRLFEADVCRQEFEPSLEEGFVVSPENAREQLATFIKRAKKSLVDLRSEAGRSADDSSPAPARQSRRGHPRDRQGGQARRRHTRAETARGRLHVRAMVRDGDTAFVGSQSLRALELDMRREVGIIVRDPKVVKGIQDVFEQDWARTDLGQKEIKQLEKAEAETELVAS